MVKSTVAIIGAGIVGSFIFNTLVLNGVDCVLIEKQEDVALGSTKANSGIIHAGYDCKPGTLKALFNVAGNKMYSKIAKRLGETFEKTGSLVVGDKKSLPVLQDLLNRGKQNGVGGLKILNKKQLKKLEPNLNKNICYGLYAKTAGLISPYHFCISLVEEGLLNGGHLFLNTTIEKIDYTKNNFILKSKKETFICDYLINACAEGVNVIHELLGEPKINMTFTKGEYILLDNSEKSLVSRPIFPLPSKLGKGVLACPTVNKNIFFGPTAADCKTYETTVNYEDLSTIKARVVEMVDNINFRKTIKLYAGVRVKCNDDFYLKFSQDKPNFLTIGGICSPGLSSAPAIADWVLKNLQTKGLQTKKIKAKRRLPYTNINKLSPAKLDKLIKKNKDYGEIICRCEKISKGEILEVLNGPIKNLTTDGVKRRLRTTMGRCQGSFCYPKLLMLMANYYKTDAKNVALKGEKSLVVGNIKEGGIYE